VVEVAGWLSYVTVDLDRAIQLALAEEPRGVVCDLSDGLKGFEPTAVEVLATAGRHVHDWPGIPVAVAHPDPRVQQALREHPMGRHLIVTTSLICAVAAVLEIPVTLAVEGLHLAAHPSTPRFAREFVTRTLLDWRLGRVIPFAALVISELVASSTINAKGIDLSVVWHQGALRLTVRDHGPALPGQLRSAPELHARRPTVVAGLSRAFGVLPTADGGKVFWAVLEAPQPNSSTSTKMANSNSEPVKNARILKVL